jgi:hypothetical protein
MPNNRTYNERFDFEGKTEDARADYVSSPITKRVYNMALDEFMIWYQQEPQPGFTKAHVSAWRVSLEARKLGSSSIIIRTLAIRKLGLNDGPRPRKTREIALFLAVLLGCAGRRRIRGRGADRALICAPLGNFRSIVPFAVISDKIPRYAPHC